MLNDKILEFYSELREEVQDYVKTNGPVSVNTAFKTLFLSYSAVSRLSKTTILLRLSGNTIRIL